MSKPSSNEPELDCFETYAGGYLGCGSDYAWEKCIGNKFNFLISKFTSLFTLGCDKQCIQSSILIYAITSKSSKLYYCINLCYHFEVIQKRPLCQSLLSFWSYQENTIVRMVNLMFKFPAARRTHAYSASYERVPTKTRKLHGRYDIYSSISFSPRVFFLS